MKATGELSKLVYNETYISLNTTQHFHQTLRAWCKPTFLKLYTLPL